MTVGQLELPLFETRSTPDNPVPEQDRTHPAQMIIRHCGKARDHVSHAYDRHGFPWGCPGTPDLRDGGERERVRQMELRTYDCGVKREFHEPHPHPDGGACPGLTTLHCGNDSRHAYHRWWTDTTFHWCNGTFRAGRPIEDVELP